MFRDIRQQCYVSIFLFLAAVFLYCIYSQAAGLTWQFDDRINLSGLANASNWQGLRDFLFGGIAGPSGRSIALLSFLPNYSDWPGNPWGMVRSALIWHAMNAFLVFMLARILLIQRYSAGSALWMAAFVAVIWAALPIHASGLLMPVQRMVHVSAFFVLGGLVSFCYLRICFAGSQGLVASALMFFVLLSFGALAVFSKENGVVLATFVVVVDRILLRHLPPPMDIRLWRSGMVFSLLLVPALLAYYLISGWDEIQVLLDYSRGRSMSEHLATEVVVLWEYVRQIALPRAAMLGPFHDGHYVYSWGDVQPWIALFGWFAVVLVALFWSRRSYVGGVALFAVLFYLSAHQVESSVVPLELYFEHRNYLAALGLVFFAVVGLRECMINDFARLMVGAGVAVLQVFVLQQTTSLWGQPLIAAEVWYVNSPDSPRATQTLSWQYGLYGHDEQALAVLDRYSSSSKDPLGISIQAMEKACSIESAGRLQQRFQRLFGFSQQLRRPAEVVVGLAPLGRRIRDGECKSISVESYEKLLSALLAIPSMQHSPRVRHHVYFELALVAKHNDSEREFLRYAKLAFNDFPSFSVARLVAGIHFQRGENAEAIAWIESAMKRAPNGASGSSWREELNSMRTAIVRVESLLNTVESERQE